MSRVVILNFYEYQRKILHYADQTQNVMISRIIPLDRCGQQIIDSYIITETHLDMQQASYLNYQHKDWQILTYTHYRFSISSTCGLIVTYGICLQRRWCGFAYTAGDHGIGGIDNIRERVPLHRFFGICAFNCQYELRRVIAFSGRPLIDLY